MHVFESTCQHIIWRTNVVYYCILNPVMCPRKQSIMYFTCSQILVWCQVWQNYWLFDIEISVFFCCVMHVLAAGKQKIACTCCHSTTVKASAPWWETREAMWDQHTQMSSALGCNVTGGSGVLSYLLKNIKSWVMKSRRETRHILQKQQIKNKLWLKISR